MSAFNSFISRYNIVKQIPIFSKLGWMDLQRIARKSILDEYKKGDIIRKEGDPPDFFYCLISGRIQAYTFNAYGIKDNVDFIHRGVHFGIISLLTGENHSLTFEAVNDSIVLKIPKDDFHSILNSIPNLGAELSQNLSKRVRSQVKGTKTIFESKIIAVYSPVSGTGSSTYATNLTFSLEKETRKKVLFINLHLAAEKQEPKSDESIAQVTPKWKMSAVSLKEIAGNHTLIHDSVVSENNVSFLNVSFEKDDASLKKEISHFVSTFAGEYHYVVVDLPNDMDNIVAETLTQSDLVHLITTDKPKDLILIRKVIDRLEMNLKGSFREDKIKVIIRNIHDQSYLSFEEIDRTIDYSVYNMLPLIQPDELSVNHDQKVLHFHSCDPKSEYAQKVRRIAREIGGVLVGVVLGGGAALGVAHIGVIRVLEEENVPVDIVIGSSMGALIGAMWCIGRNSHELEIIAREFEKKSAMLKLFDPVIPIKGLVGGRLIKRWLKKHLSNKTFYSTSVPFKAVAYDLMRREELIIESGSLVDGVRKSIAIPGVIEPVKEKDQLIIDGGVLNPLPTNVLVGRGIKKVIAVNVLQSPDDVSEGFDLLKSEYERNMKISFFKNPFKFIGFRFSAMLGYLFGDNISNIIVQTLQASEYVIAESSGQQADVLIHPDLVGINWFELNRVDDLISCGEAAARKHLAQIKQLINE